MNSRFKPSWLETRTRENTAFITGLTLLEAGQMAPALTRLNNIVRELYGRGVYFYLVGGELGFDMLAAEYLIRLRDNPPGKDIMIYSVLPCREWNKKWPDCLKTRENRILMRSDRIICTSKKYTEDRKRRNEILINSSGHCICFCNKRNDKVAEVVKEAANCGLKIHNASSFDVRQINGRIVRPDIPRICGT